MWDAENMFSRDQNIAAATETDSDDIVDAGPPDAGKGEPVYLHVVLGSGFAAAVMTVKVKTADAADMTGAADLIAYTVPAALVQRGGSVLAVALPSGCKRYLRASYAGAAGGMVTAGLVLGPDTAGI